MTTCGKLKLDTQEICIFSGTVLFVSSGLGMCDRLNSLVCTLPFYTFYNLVRLVYKKRTASIQKSKMCLIIQCTLWPVK